VYIIYSPYASTAPAIWRRASCELLLRVFSPTDTPCHVGGTAAAAATHARLRFVYNTPEAESTLLAWRWRRWHKGFRPDDDDRGWRKEKKCTHRIVVRLPLSVRFLVSSVLCYIYIYQCVCVCIRRIAILSESVGQRTRQREKGIYIYVCVCAPRRDGWKVIGAESVKRRATKTENGDGDKNSGRWLAGKSK